MWNCDWCGELMSSDDEDFAMNHGEIVCESCFDKWVDAQNAERE